MLTKIDHRTSCFATVPIESCFHGDLLPWSLRGQFISEPWIFLVALTTALAAFLDTGSSLSQLFCSCVAQLRRSFFVLLLDFGYACIDDCFGPTLCFGSFLL
jgi:hypothetical protein